MSNKVKILFVDREQGEYLLIAEILSHIRQVNYELVWCDQLDAALPKILSQEFDVVLLDYYWGAESARDLLNAARLQACQTPIVVMTDEMETEVDREAIRAGAADYLIKGQIDHLLLERALRYAIERKQTEQHLTRLAHYDSLTDIPNRILFRDRLEHAVHLAERDHTSFTLMFIDLNGFKQVNDNFGHDAGDAIIRICAERLNSCLRRSDSVARMGGDEFTLLLQNIANSTDVAHIAQKVIDSIQQPADINGHEVVVGCSIGIAIYPEAGRDADSLLKHADMAMYKAKQVSGSNYRFFTEMMNQDVRRQLRQEADLRAALRYQQFVLHYSPRIDMATGKVVAIEAQLRWDKPGVGLLNPSEFIATAEETGVITAIGYWVLRQACHDIKLLQGFWDEQLMMSIHLSMRQFKDENLVHEVARIFADNDIQPGDIEFEITETVFADNIDLVSLCMRPLSFFGINFLLDNFGAGNSSLLHLQRLPISTVKIDLGFLQELNRSHTDKRLVSAMISLAHNLGKLVVAEGVETKEQKDWLKEMGCNLMQGRYIAESKSYAEMLAWLQETSVPHQSKLN
ncbi:EAL domain protein [Cellvibrio sp. BR]|jgi:diguanylate cyclase (GGDEF)-like protein|uniref:putative bifunctional diguanylate cyclase/phosphodiesterase n=1 Tax=unclassified Cellvibrio TaxID=2624793 RepID=UPI0002601380|nr:MULTISPECIES: EAL domain-containing protein [unclassified Cellvibrio]EIK46732.1 EAL domain protein [Cellvibrio sp. BR]UUA71381.1 EAL domain-containing protein [Cellvibrio sp. QJXJ]